MAWDANFEAAWPRFAAQYGEPFRRQWRYYLLNAPARSARATCNCGNGCCRRTACAAATAGRGEPSRRLVRHQLRLELGDLVLELELALLQPPHRQFVRVGIALQPRDRGVEVAVRSPQFHQAVGQAGRSAGSSMRLMRRAYARWQGPATPAAMLRFSLSLR